MLSTSRNMVCLEKLTSSKFGIKADNKLVSASQNEQWPEKYVPVKGKTASTGSS